MTKTPRVNKPHEMLKIHSRGAKGATDKPQPDHKRHHMAGSCHVEYVTYLIQERKARARPLIIDIVWRSVSAKAMDGDSRVHEQQQQRQPREISWFHVMS